MYNFEKYRSKLNIGRSFKLFYPYMNDEMGNVCIVREVGDDGFNNPGIYDIFAVGYKYLVNVKNEPFEREYIKGFRFSDKCFYKEELEKRHLNDSGFLLFALYIKQYYGIDFTDKYDEFERSLWCRDFYSFRSNNLVFYIYNTHRRTQHRCYDYVFDYYSKLRYGFMRTITMKDWTGYNSSTSCPLCLGCDYRMDYPEYKKLNAVHKFL